MDNTSSKKKLFLDKLITIMARFKTVVPPSLKRLFNDLGEKIHLARLRRQFSAELVSERAGMTRKTLRGIERGDPSVVIIHEESKAITDLSLLMHKFLILR